MRGVAHHENAVAVAVCVRSQWNTCTSSGWAVAPLWRKSRVAPQPKRKPLRVNAPIYFHWPGSRASSSRATENARVNGALCAVHTSPFARTGVRSSLKQWRHNSIRLSCVVWTGVRRLKKRMAFRSRLSWKCLTFRIQCCPCEWC